MLKKDDLAQRSARFSDRLAKLPTAKRALLEKRLRGESENAAATIPPRSEPGPVPLSFAQQRLWFLDQWEPDSPFYNVPIAMHLAIPLNVKALENCLNEIVRRHEALRTTFTALHGQPVQVIAPPPAVALPIVDLQELPASAREAFARRLLAERAQQPFDLARGPLLQATLLRLDREEHVLLLAMHHIVSDGWSVGEILLREMDVLYRAFSAGEPSPLPELPIQYADFAVWQRQWLQGEVLETYLDYWKQQLGGAPDLLELPTDRPRPPFQTYRGASQSFVVPQATSGALKALCQQTQATWFMLLLAAFKTLLHRYTGQMDIVVGTPVANRDRPETAGLIGFFVNTLALRTSMPAGITFRELLSRVREVTLGAYAHQDLPFEMLVEHLNPERSTSHTPLFQVMFTFHNLPAYERKPTGISLYGLEGETAKFDLTLSMGETDRGLSGALEYNTDLFEAESIGRLLGHLQVLLAGIVADPDRRLAELPILTEEEQHHLLAAWNNTQKDYLDGLCIHQLFEAQAERTPDAIAVVFPSDKPGGQDTLLTYGEVNRRANQVAQRLQALGVGPETLVGLCVERSPEMLVGLLGSLKAGGGYLPLDPAYPQERLALILEDAQAQVVLTQTVWAARFPPESVRVVCLDGDEKGLAQESETNPSLAVSAENVAYVIYTSGSTGKPKGVCVSHSVAVNHFTAMQAAFGLNSTDRVLEFASLSFDVSLEQILPTLFSGAALVLRGDEVWGAADFLRKIQELNLTVFNVTPAYCHQLIQESHLSSLDVLSPSLRLAVVGGEVILPETVRLWQQTPLSSVRLLNAYGPTEAVITASIFEIPPGFGRDSLASRVPIGRPLAHRAMYVLDPKGNPVPVGVWGELHIGGPLLARGYLNRPDLTAEHFVPNPFAPLSPLPQAGGEPRGGTRLYKTGDLARYRPDGNIEFGGRADQQVKVRGYRIELGEIEAVLSQAPEVQEAVVVAQESEVGGKRLVAYVVPAGSPAPTVSGLRSYLKDRLPEYMTPGVYVFLEALPLMPNGKVDRKALPAPGGERPELGKAYVAPRSVVEEQLAAVWAQILKVERVGVHDNFFELGGHSLLATQIVSRVRDTFRIELPLRRLFEQPSVAGLAGSVEEALRAGRGAPVPPMGPAPREGEVPLSFAQERLWFLDQMEPGSAAYNIPVALRLRGVLDLAAMGRALSEIQRRHEALRTTFVSVDGRPRQVVSPAAGMAMGLVDLQELAADERERVAGQLAAQEAQRPFDLAAGPLVRASWLRLSEAEHIALLTMHHIVSDGWSMGVLTRELSVLYAAFSAGQGSPLAELPLQYADYAVWQREWLQGEVLARQMGYWKQQLAGVRVLQLPTDRARPAVQTYRGGEQTIELATPLEALKALSRQEGCTMFMTLLAAFEVLLQRYTGQADIAVGTPVANRNRTEIEGLVGFFVNTLALRVDLGGNPSFRELLRRVQETTLEAYLHQDVPFEKLVDELQPERDLSYTPLFQVMFTFQSGSGEALELPGLRVSGMTSEGETAKFDLTLSMAETDRGLSGAIEYNADLFEAESIRRMLGHLQVLLAGIVADPDRRLAELPILTEAEQHQLLTEWNARVPYPTDRCIHELFEAQAGRTSEAVAVVFEDQHVTYAELDRRANQMAQYVQAHGVGPERLVALLLERSVDMLIAILGVWKAGGAYVPIDPSYPAERIQFMLADTQAVLGLTQQHLSDRWPDTAMLRLRVDTEWEQVGACSRARPDSGVTPANLAYTIYTSGSTGRPKGVAITHGNVCPLLHWGYAVVGLTASERVVQYLSYAFDWSVWEMFIALTSGTTLVMLARETVLDAAAARAFMVQQHITVLHATPTQFQELLGSSSRLATLRYACIGAEKLGADLVERSQAQLPGECRIFNMYGPTEATIMATTLEIERARVAEYRGRASIPIGPPIANTRCYIVDGGGQLVPPGVAGQLLIGGDGLARGYVGRPDLTLEKFVPDPFGAGQRAYATGDLARWLPGGELEFVGRVDDQVKLRGYRIELGEIEAVLGQHAGVAAVVVAVVGEASSVQRLVAYVVRQAGARLESKELREYVRAKLPEYMTPGAFVFLEALPLMPNGKVDRKALPAPGGERPELGAPLKPRDKWELELAQIWEMVLNVHPIGMRDNFFELGGHSLLAVRLLALIEQRLGRKLALTTLFQGATIEQLAGRLRQPSAPVAWSPLVEIQAGGSKPPFFCVHPGGGHVLCYMDLARQLGPQQPFYGFQSRGLDEAEEPLVQIEVMASHYVKTLRQVQPQGPYFLGGWSMGGLVAFEMAQQLHTQGQAVALLALFDSHAPVSGRKRAQADRMALLNSFALDMGLGPDSLSQEHLAQLDLEQQLACVLEQARQVNLVPPNIELAQVRRFFHVFETNSQAMQDYVPRVYPGPVTLLRASEPLEEGKRPTLDSKLNQLSRKPKDPTLGWRKLAGQGIQVYIVPGNHFTIVRQPHVQNLAEKLRLCLDEAQFKVDQHGSL